VPARLSRIEPDLVLFESWHGSYSDNPRGISEELLHRSSPLRQAWVLRERPVGLPESVAVVAPGTRRYLEYLGRARYLVSNNSMPGYFSKKRGTTYLQTWHGTPLKRIGFDIARPAFRDSKRSMENLRRDVAQWDYLISQNQFSTEILRNAFHYRGPIMEVGYPRNDLLSSPRATPLRQETRQRLGIADGVRAVLYVPTWRDDDAFSLHLGLASVVEALGEGCVVLLRVHPDVAHTFALRGMRQVLDVTLEPDIRELYLAADVLVTDYSSAMFDFAVTGKPMLFFTYDLPFYRDRLRGFYFDFEAEAPGPLLRTTDDVIASLLHLEEVTPRYAAAYERFVQRFCHLDDGHAAERVIRVLFEGDASAAEAGVAVLR
jgi:CDP-glycerol glycerophosphotransferase